MTEFMTVSCHAPKGSCETQVGLLVSQNDAKPLLVLRRFKKKPRGRSGANADALTVLVKMVASRSQEKTCLRSLREIGGARRDRTADLLRARQALSQLSYGPNFSGCERIIRMCSTNVSVFRQCKVAAAQLSVIWWVWVDLNHRPHPYQGCALTN
jgi:hypothetical protein